MSNVAAGKDTDDEGESLNDVETTLNSVGIALRKSQYEWRSFEDVLDEVADKWAIFEDTEKSHIATAIAGTRQQENFRAMMNNWDEVKKLTDVAEQSMGSASEKMEIYLDSVEAKTKELEATWEEFIIQLNQSDSYKGFLDAIIFLIENLPTVITLVSSLIVTWKSFSIASSLMTQAQSMRELMTVAINTEAMAKTLAAQAQAQENAQEEQSIIIKGYKSSQLSALVAAKQAETAATEGNIIAEQTETAATEANIIADEQSIQKRTIKGATTLQGIVVKNTDTTATEANTVATEASTIADEGKIATTITLKTVLAGLAVTIGVVTAAISIAAMGVMAYEGYIRGLQETVSKTTKTVEALQEEIDELDNAVDKYEEIINSTTSAAEQKESLTKLQEQLISTYGDEAKALDLVNGKYENQIQILKNLQKDKLAKQVQEYTNSQGDRDKLLNKSTTNLVIGKDEKQNYDRNLLQQIKKIVEDNGGEFGLNKDGDYGIWATGKTQPRIYEALEEYQKQLIQQGDKNNAKKIADMFNRSEMFFSNMKDDYEKYKEASEQERQKDLAQFQLDNFDAFQDYKDMLEKRSKLYEQYTKTQNEKEKKQLLEQLEDVSKQALTKKQELYDKINGSNVKGLSESFEDFFKQYNVNNLFQTDPTALSYFDDLAQKVGKTTEAGKNIQTFGQTIQQLDEEFETGKINATQYFNGINNQIKNIDLSKINDTYGGIKNLNSMLSSLAGNSASYIEKIMNAFGSGNMEEFEFFDNLSAAVNNLDTISTTMLNADKKGIYQQNGAVKNYDSFKENLYGKDAQSKMDVSLRYVDENGNEISTDGNGNPVVEPKYVDKVYDLKFSTDEAENKMKSLTDEADRLSSEIADALTSGAKDSDDDIVDKRERLKEINDEIKEIQEGTKGLDDTLKDVKKSMKEINDMDFKGLDKAYENLNQAFADNKLKNNVDMTLDQIDSGLKDSAIKMASFLKEQVNSSNEAYSNAAKGALDTMGLMADASVDSIATAIINNTTNLNAAANAGNKIASTAMGKTIQNLGQMLIKLGDAMDGFEVSIPIKIPMIKLDLESFKNGGSLFTAGQGNLIETEIKIGAAGTIKSIGNMLANADIADTIGSMFTPIEAPIKKSNNKNTKGYTPSGSGKKKKSGSGGGNSYSPADAAQDKKEILSDIEQYEADIAADLYDQTEELINHYDLQKNKLATLKEELDYYDGIYDSTENTTKWLETQNKLLANQSKSVAAMQQSNAKIEKQREKIYKENKQYNVKGWFDSEGNETLAYGDLINKRERKIESIQESAAAKMRKQYNKIKNSTDKDTIQKAKDKIKLIKEEAETKAKAVEDEIKKIEQIYEDVDKLNEAWRDNKEAIRDALAEMADRVKDIRDTLVDQLLDTLQRAVDRENTSLENSATRIEQLVSVQEKYNDILNDLYDTQADLDSELQSNLDSYEYLDEQMRQLMFNEEDYKVLSNTINGIQKDITDIWADHYNQISNLTEDEMYKAEYITSETERQLEAKQKEYELAKAELDVAKAQTNLQNVQNERNTRMLINGQWVWTANPDAVKEARKNLADAQSAKNRVVREQSQQAVIDSMNKLIDADNRQMDKNNFLLEKVEKAIEDQTTEVKTVQEALNNIKTENLPAMSTLIEGAFGKDGKSGYIQELLTNINESSQTLISSLANPTIDEAISSLKGGKLSKKNFESLVDKLGYSFDPTTGKITTQTGSFNASYQGFVKESLKDKQTKTDKETGKQVTDNGKNKTSTNTNKNADKKKDNGNGFPKTGKVTTQSANLMLRSKPSTSGKILKRMPKGSKVEVLAETNKNWAQIKYNGKTGYASRQYLTYDQGGLAYGDGVFLKDVNVPERVLSPRQTKAFENLVDNLTINPVLQALTKSVKGSSNFNQLAPAGMGDKNYYFSNFTVQADNISEFINSLEGMIPISKK